MSEVKRYNLRQNIPAVASTFLPDVVVSATDCAALEAELAKSESRLHDVATVCATAEQQRDAALAECERFRADAERYRWLVERGDACQWMNIIRIDPGDYDDLDGAIDAAMSAKP